MRRRALLLAAPLLAAAGEAAAPGIGTIDTAAAWRLFQAGGAAWIDVLDAPRRPAGLPADTLWRPAPRFGIPGSLWLPGAGHEVLPPEAEARFLAALEQATGGDRDRPLVVYCLMDCRLSRTAAQRAAGWGWRRVLWYREGTDGWEAAGLPLAAAQPAAGWR
ncbi:rhodanese-like domain-containing protein [Paracraurococcus ruber]|uniref:rhodanese-like domain-containing protein n=1 Tax=Paracraurococcus ruber TaxID=77675 RepID=UPI0013050E2A|nr:rhodanese-like domain-containing protein [Paracraurococcus ruber]